MTTATEAAYNSILDTYTPLDVKDMFDQEAVGHYTTSPMEFI